eukprot:6490419-Amphidinium_carterae.8
MPQMRLPIPIVHLTLECFNTMNSVISQNHRCADHRDAYQRKLRLDQTLTSSMKGHNNNSSAAAEEVPEYVADAPGKKKEV